MLKTLFFTVKSIVTTKKISIKCTPKEMGRDSKHITTKINKTKMKAVREEIESKESLKHRANN